MNGELTLPLPSSPCRIRRGPQRGQWIGTWKDARFRGGKIGVMLLDVAEGEKAAEVKAALRTVLERNFRDPRAKWYILHALAPSKED